MFTIYDTRPNHQKTPYLFTTSNGKQEAMYFHNIEDAERLARKMNTMSQLTTYEVRSEPYNSFVGRIAPTGINFGI